MIKERGFTAYYRRRLLTPLEQMDKVCLEMFGTEIVKEIKRSSVMYHYFKGEEYRPVYHYWGAGDTF